MSIEKNIERIADALEKIAKQTKVTPKKPAVEKKEAPKKPAVEKKEAPKKPAVEKKEAPKKSAVEKEESPKTTPKKVTVVSDVQDALVRVANEAGRDAARGVLAEFDGALKVGDLQERDFDAVIDLCEKTLKEAVGA